MTTLRNALEALKDAIPNRSNWAKTVFGFFPTHSCGICGNVEEYFMQGESVDPGVDDALMELGLLIDQYVEESNRGRSIKPPAYPVGGEDEYCAERQAGTLWYNPRRLALLDWLLEHCK